MHHLNARANVDGKSVFGFYKGNVGWLLIAFLDLFGNKFDSARTGISVNGVIQYDELRYLYALPTSSTSYAAITIDSPFWPTKNIATGCYRIHDVLSLFKKYHSKLVVSVKEYENASAPVDILRKVVPIKWGWKSKKTLLHSLNTM